MITLPAIQGWPYASLNQELQEYTRFWKSNPRILFVGRSLWAMLLQAADAEEFYAPANIPIHLDKLHLLEPHEFIFAR